MDFNELKTPVQLMAYMEKNLRYGFISSEKLYTWDMPLFQEKMDELYRLCINEELIKIGYGVCWDFVELQRAFFERRKIKHESFYGW